MNVTELEATVLPSTLERKNIEFLPDFASDGVHSLSHLVQLSWDMRYKDVLKTRDCASEMKNWREGEELETLLFIGYKIRCC